MVKLGLGKRRAGMLIAFALIALPALTACGGTDESDGRSVRDDAATAVPSVTDLATDGAYPTDWNPVFQSPDALAEYLVDAYLAGDWYMIWMSWPGSLREEVDADQTEIVRTYSGMLPGIVERGWTVETYGARAAVRSVREPTEVIVLVEDEDEGWRYDPGPTNRYMMKLAQVHGTPLAVGSGPQFASIAVTGGEKAPIPAECFDHTAEMFDPRGGEPTFSVLWRFGCLASARLGVKDARWSIGSAAHGRAEVIWTTGVWANAQVEFPTPELFYDLDDRELEAVYEVSFRLVDLPYEWADGLELHVEGLELDLGEERVVLDLIYHLENESFPVPWEE